MCVTIVWCFVATCVVLAGAIPIDMFYPFGPKHGDSALEKGFMERSEPLRVEGGFNYLGSRFYNVWVSKIASYKDSRGDQHYCQVYWHT